MATRSIVATADSPSAFFVLERLASSEKTPSELLWLRRSQIDAGMVDPSMGWFDLGIVARYLDELPELARQGFVNALDLSSPDRASRRVALGELSSVLMDLRVWEGYVAVEQERAGIESDFSARAASWYRVGEAYELHLDDIDGALRAYEQSLREDDRYFPALDGISRILRAQGRLDRLCKVEANYAPTKVERALALRKVGEILIDDESTLDDGIDRLKQGLELIPGDLTTLSLLEVALSKKQAWSELLDVYEGEIEVAGSDALKSLLLSRISVVATERLDDRRLSITALRRIADLGKSKVPDTLARLAALLQMEGEVVELVGVLERIAGVVEEKSVRLSLLDRIATEYAKRGHTSKATEVFLTALETAPPGHPFLLSGVPTFQQAGMERERAACYERCASAGPASERALWRCRAADVHARHLEEPGRAVELLREAMDLDPTSRPALEALEARLAFDERWAELRELVEQYGPSDRLLLRRAMLTEALGDRDEAIRLYAQARDAGVVFATLPLLRLLAVDDRWDELYALYAEGETSGFSAVHASYRAAEIAAERLGDLDKASTHFAELITSSKDALAPVTILLTLVSEPVERLPLIRAMATATDDEAVRVACREEEADLLDALGRGDEAVDVRRRTALSAPASPTLSVLVELALEERRDRHGLVELLRAALDSPQLPPELRADHSAAIGRHLVELGSHDEATRALEAAIEQEGHSASLLSRITLARLARLSGDGKRYFAGLRTLAAVLPPGPEAAVVSRLGALEPGIGVGAGSSVENLQSALRDDPLDYATLATLEGAGASAEELYHHLKRAFEVETNPQLLSTVGALLCSRLLDEDRRRPARHVLEKVLKVAPDDLRAHLLAAELYRRDKVWLQVAKSLERIAEHEAADRKTRLMALGYLATVTVRFLKQRQTAKRVADRLTKMTPRDHDLLDVLLYVQELVDNASGAATSLVALAEAEGVEPEERAAHLAKLAWIQERKLNNAAAALETLSKIELDMERGKAACSFFALAERHERWDLVADALRYVLDNVELEGVEEIETRRRLAKLLEGPLARPDEALGQYQRLVELDPANAALRERLVELAPPTDPEQALEALRELIEADPLREASYRAVRKLTLSIEEHDMAFCAEAVLEGMGWATDEESYFFKQRRLGAANLLASPPLDATGLRIICPELDEPSMAVLRAIDEALATVFPFDEDAYGLTSPDDAPPDRELQLVATAAAQVFGQSNIRLSQVSARLMPTIELGLPRVLILPRTIVECSPREKSFVCGALLCRAAIGGVLVDPNRQSVLTDLQIEYVVWAACELALGRDVAPFKRSVVFADIKRRLGKALKGAIPENLLTAAQALVDGGLAPTGSEIRAIVARASARAGLTAAVNPAVGVACLRTWADMFAAPATNDEDRAWPDQAAKAALAYAVSEGHQFLRQRLGLEVRSPR